MTSPYPIFRPYILVALAAFILGFAGFLILGGGAVARVGDGLTILAVPASAPGPYAGAGPVRDV